MILENNELSLLSDFSSTNAILGKLYPNNLLDPSPINNQDGSSIPLTVSDQDLLSPTSFVDNGLLSNTAKNTVEFESFTNAGTQNSPDNLFFTQQITINRVPNYDAVVVNRRTDVILYDAGTRIDGDTVSVVFNGNVIRPNFLLQDKITAPTIKLDLRVGRNELTLISISTGITPFNTVGIEFQTPVIYGKNNFQANLGPGLTTSVDFGLPTVRVNRAASPQAAKHIEDVLVSPQIMTIDRKGAKARRTSSLKASGIAPQPGKDRDEAPPAIFVENGGNASVRLIDLGDNRSAGRQIGAQVNNYGPNNITLNNFWNVDFFVDTKPITFINSPVNTLSSNPSNFYSLDHQLQKIIDSNQTQPNSSNVSITLIDLADNKSAKSKTKTELDFYGSQNKKHENTWNIDFFVDKQSRDFTYFSVNTLSSNRLNFNKLDLQIVNSKFMESLLLPKTAYFLSFLTYSQYQ